MRLGGIFIIHFPLLKSFCCLPRYQGIEDIVNVSYLLASVLGKVPIKSEPLKVQGLSCTSAEQPHIQGCRTQGSPSAESGILYMLDEDP